MENGCPCCRPTDRLIKGDEAATVLGVSESRLEKWRVTGDGPPYIQYSGEGGSIRYSERMLWDWIYSQVKASTSDPGKPPETFAERQSKAMRRAIARGHISTPSLIAVMIVGLVVMAYLLGRLH
jgi:hypothetical protein